MRRLIILILAVTLTLGLAVTASADTISWNSWQQHGLSINYKEGNKYKSTSLVGSFDVSWDEGESFTAYCVDLLTGGVGGAYDVTDLSLLDPDEYSSLYQAAWIMDNYSPALGHEVEGYNDSQLVTAIQSALWALTTPSPHDFELTGVSGEGYWEWEKVGKHWKQVWNPGETVALYAELLEAAGEVNFSNYEFSNKYYFAQSDDKQDLLIAGNGHGGDTPEPGTMLLLGSALGFFAWRRRRKSA